MVDVRKDGLEFVGVLEKYSETCKILYELLKERAENESISHKEMPSWPDHCHFVSTHPYNDWCIILIKDNPVGSIYITQDYEIGISIFKKYRRMNYATRALKKFILGYGLSEVYANINPKNKKSIALFKKLGFKHIQNTYKLSR